MWFKIVYKKNKFIDRIVNNIRFEQNLIYMLRTYGTWNLMVEFSKFTLKKEIYEKFEEFHSKFWRKLCSTTLRWVKLKPPCYFIFAFTLISTTGQVRNHLMLVLLRTYVYIISISFDKMHFTCIWVNLSVRGKILSQL